MSERPRGDRTDEILDEFEQEEEGREGQEQPLQEGGGLNVQENETTEALDSDVETNDADKDLRGPITDEELAELNKEALGKEEEVLAALAKGEDVMEAGAFGGAEGGIEADGETADFETNEAAAGATRERIIREVELALAEVQKDQAGLGESSRRVWNRAVAWGTAGLAVLTLFLAGCSGGDEPKERGDRQTVVISSPEEGSLGKEEAEKLAKERDDLKKQLEAKDKKAGSDKERLRKLGIEINQLDQERNSLDGSLADVEKRTDAAVKSQKLLIEANKNAIVEAEGGNVPLKREYLKEWRGARSSANDPFVRRITERLDLQAAAGTTDFEATLKGDVKTEKDRRIGVLNKDNKFYTDKLTRLYPGGNLDRKAYGLNNFPFELKPTLKETEDKAKEWYRRRADAIDTWATTAEEEALGINTIWKDRGVDRAKKNAKAGSVVFNGPETNRLKLLLKKNEQDLETLENNLTQAKFLREKAKDVGPKFRDVKGALERGEEPAAADVQRIREDMDAMRRGSRDLGIGRGFGGFSPLSPAN